MGREEGGGFRIKKNKKRIKKKKEKKINKMKIVIKNK